MTNPKGTPSLQPCQRSAPDVDWLDSPLVVAVALGVPRSVVDSARTGVVHPAQLAVVMRLLDEIADHLVRTAP